MHAFVMGEVASGNLSHRAELLKLWSRLPVSRRLGLAYNGHD